MGKIKKWSGSVPKVCQLCNAPIGGWFYDAKTTVGPWGILDEQCFQTHGIGLGKGKGQKYQTDTLEKIGG